MEHLLLILLGILFFVIISSIREISQYERGILFSFGKFTKILEPGWNLVLPLKTIQINNKTHQYFIGNINDYYKFYRYTPTHNKHKQLLNGVIDWNRDDNKIPFELISSNNITTADAINIDEWNKLKQIYILQILYKYILNQSNIEYQQSDIQTIDNID